MKNVATSPCTLCNLPTTQENRWCKSHTSTTEATTELQTVELVCSIFHFGAPHLRRMGVAGYGNSLSDAPVVESRLLPTFNKETGKVERKLVAGRTALCPHCYDLWQINNEVV